MTPGRALLLARQRLRGGLRTTYYRERVAPRILLTPPVIDTVDPTCEVHALTCAGDWQCCMWALKTFYRYSARPYRLCIHEDGTLSPRECEELRRHFPRARLIRRAEADARAESLLRDYPRAAAFRRTNLLAPKLLDFLAYLESDRLLVLDSDVLFFDRPEALIARIESPERRNAWNADFGDAYTVTADQVQRALGFDLVSRVNSGLGLVHRDSLRLDWIEEFLGLPGITEGYFWRVEQTLYALASSRFGTDLLPAEYTLRLAKGIEGRPFRHYVGRIRGLFYSEGLSHLVKRGFLAGATPWESRLSWR